MFKRFPRLITLGIVAVMLSAALATEVSATSFSAMMPVAGIARALDEGKSVIGVQADKIKKDADSDSSIADIAEEAEELATESYEFDVKVSTIKETVSTSDPAIITVGAASADTNETISESVLLEESANLEVPEAEEIIVGSEEGDTDIDASEEGVYLEEETGNTVSEGEIPEDTDEEDFSNLVIAKVNDYVNVRAEGSEESEIVGKLYDKSVGELLAAEGDWYKIKSGNCEGYVKGEFVVTGDEAVELAKEVGTRMATVTTTTLYVRQDASTEAEVIGMVPIEDELLVLEEVEGWAKVSVEEGDGYVSTEFVNLHTEFVYAESKEEEEARKAKEEAEKKAAREAARKAEEKQRKEQEKNNKKNNGGAQKAPTTAYAAAGSGTGSSVANFALQFVGNPYVYGGSSLTNGTDCSGFVMSVYRNFGVSLPHSSGGDRGVGYDVGGIGNAQAGDIVCYSGHVGIYIGNGQIVHASTPRTGITVSNANYRSILAVRRIF